MTGQDGVAPPMTTAKQGEIVLLRVAEVTIPEDSPWRPALLVAQDFMHPEPDTWALVVFGSNGMRFQNASHGPAVGQWSHRGESWLSKDEASDTEPGDDAD